MEVDGKESIVEELVVIKEYVFVISDDLVQDYDLVYYVQLFIVKYLIEDFKVIVEKMYEFIDGCVVQYKLRYCIGDFFCCVADFGFLIQQNYFEILYVKGE